MSPADDDLTMQIPRADRRPPGGSRRRRTWWVAIGGVLVAAAVVAVALVVVSRDDGPGVVSERLTPGATDTTVAGPGAQSSSSSVAVATTRPPASPPPSTSPPSTSPPTTARLSSASRLSLDGIGPVDVGMTLDQASAAAGTPIRIRDTFGIAGECAYAQADDGPAGLLFMVERGKIVRVDVGGALQASPVRTVSGIGIGSTEADVQRTYPGRIQVKGHPYLQTGHYLVYTPSDAALKHLSLIFETDGQRVTSFRSGLAGPVSYIEGCA